MNLPMPPINPFNIDDIPMSVPEFSPSPSMPIIREDYPVEEVTAPTKKPSRRRQNRTIQNKEETRCIPCTSQEEVALCKVIISALLEADEKKRLVSVYKNHKEAFAWKMSDILGISLSFCKNKINFEDDAKLVIQRQRQLNPNMKEVVKKEIIKLLDAGIIYPIEDSPWVSHVHCVPKKGGMSVVTNEKNEHVPTRIITGWRVCIDYRKLNEATRKDHFPLPFMDQMLERLEGNKFFRFLDGFSGYFHIPIEPVDQEKTTFTCPYGTYAYKRMSFDLFNALTTFQRCIIAIFQDMLEISMEVFMDGFSVFRNSFYSCLANLEQMLIRCKQAHLVLT
ncbi:reverse transcriptase domain-containing protein [Tanacetum coccineum]